MIYCKKWHDELATSCPSGTPSAFHRETRDVAGQGRAAGEKRECAHESPEGDSREKKRPAEKSGEFDAAASWAVSSTKRPPPRRNLGALFYYTRNSKTALNPSYLAHHFFLKSF